MHLGEISFCDRIAYNIKSDELKSKILNEISERYNKKIINKHYDIFTDKSYNMLSSKPYIMNLRSNGNPYFLYLTKIGGYNQCIFIDKKIQNSYMYPRMVIVKLWFNDYLFNNTLMEGEMIKQDNDKWLFVLHDIFVHADKSLHNINVIKRYNLMYTILANDLQHSYQDICHFQVKKLFHYHEYDKMMKFNDELPYTSRGIYFVPLYINFSNILLNFNSDLITKKEKQIKKKFCYGSSKQTDEEEKRPVVLVEEKKDSIDERILYLQKTNVVDVYNLYENTNEESIGIAFVNKSSTSKMLRETFLNATPVDKIKFNCKYNDRFKKWQPMVRV